MKDSNINKPDTLNVRIMSVEPDDGKAWLSIKTTSPRVLLLYRNNPNFEILKDKLTHLATKQDQALISIHLIESGNEKGKYSMEEVKVGSENQKDKRTEILGASGRFGN